MTLPGQHHALLPALLILLGGCAGDPPDSPNLGRLGLQPQSPTVDISQYRAPEEAGAYRLQGNVQAPDRERVIFRYTLPEAPERQLDISLYPLPPGWHDLTQERIVSGHYGQARQAVADRSSRKPGTILRAMQEGLRRQVAGEFTVAEGAFLEEGPDQARLIILQIATLPRVFVRLTASAPEARGQEHLDDARKVMAAFLEYQRNNPDQASQ